MQDKQLKKISNSLELLGDLPVNKNAFRSRSLRKSISLPRVKHKQIITLLILMVLLMLLSMLPYRVSFHLFYLNIVSSYFESGKA
jgi:hypothetical protein